MGHIFSPPRARPGSARPAPRSAPGAPFAALLLAATLVASTAGAQPTRRWDATVFPIYSIGAGSPSPFLPSDILAPNPFGGPPIVVLPSADLGLLPGDDLDALAYRRPNAYPLFFSVDRRSTGVCGVPCGSAISAVAGQAARGQAAGDIFETAYPRFVVPPPRPVAPMGGTNVLVENQDALGLQPDVPPSASASPPIDELDALELFYVDDAPLTGTGLVYSLAPGSPTLVRLGATPGDLITSVGGVPTLIGWFRERIGLLPGDDVDALAWDSTYESLAFSLTRDSPSIGTRPWLPTDVLTFRTGGPMPYQVFPSLQFFFTGIAPNDELDAIAFLKPPPPPPPPCDFIVSGGVILGRDGFDRRGCPFVPTLVPEPAPAMLTGAGVLLVAAAGAMRRRRAG